ncbi:universal stress protein [Salinarchaeum laminariae]|uniref:universal stress protein n=1 Tax=Salinarchaeum laminariae TaxID=869888 RepID=UPI0020BFD204|nr:universal stress protein [Salinarchaeum laminariae]
MQFVVCVDGSEQSDRALAHAADLVTATGGSLTVVHAVDPGVYQRPGEGPISSRSEGEQSLVIEAIEDAEDRGETVLSEAREAVSVTVEEALLYGDPVEAIAEFVADRENVDGVVVGHRTVSDRHRQMLGSVARGLIERSPVPVTVVRED